MSDPITRGEFNEAMAGIRREMGDLKGGLERIEAGQQIFNATAMEGAIERGRVLQRLDTVETTQKAHSHRTDRIIVGLVLALVAAVLEITIRKWGGL